MKAVILGGCADMAVPLIDLLKNDKDVKKVRLADINEEKAKKISAENGAKFEGVYCNAEDRDSVISAIKGYDIAFGYVGPFYYYEKKIAGYAIEAGIDYVSISDDYDAYLSVIDLDESAKKSKVKILTGFGNSPGLTQILARKGYNSMKKPYRISVNWCAGSDESVGASNLTHLFHIFNGTTLQWFNGREERVKTGAGRKLVEFPEPIGKAHVYYTGHAESVSLPRNLPGLKEVTLHGGAKPEYIIGLVRFVSSLHLFSTHKKRAAIARFFHRIEGLFASKGIDKSVGRVEIWANNNGKEEYRYFTYVGHIANITSYPAYLAAKWLFKGKYKTKPGGVYSPEKLMEKPDTFIEELKKMGIDIYESELIQI